MAKHEKLEVGQRIWIESIWYFYTNRDRSISEYKIVEANRNSAYAVRVDNLGKDKPYRNRIDQKTRKIKGSGSFGVGEVIWESKEAFEADVKRVNDTEIAREKAIKKVNKMSLEQLQELLGDSQ
ncbi:hypothetical protein J1907_02970 [Lysinibacillus sphaericus]|uniref:hypothetical protein n=1 Tax=Lysinibacillus sphaericus TaxID=1421 RepID=UPI0005669A7D|nr:hypothetical protein [Lysinibacillus sphaericus]QTB23092.1 hypothetical protein J1907_02970 [Lysinibacillus sphaericus]